MEEKCAAARRRDPSLGRLVGCGQRLPGSDQVRKRIYGKSMLFRTAYMLHRSSAAKMRMHKIESEGDVGPRWEGATPPTLLIVDGDQRLSEYLFRFIETLGYAIDVAHTYDTALEKAQARPPDHALLEARIPGGNGLSLIRPFRDLNPSMRIVLCTAYPSIANTVEAIKLGADDYLPKPVTPVQILSAFEREKLGAEHEPPGQILSLARARWEYINMVLANCDGNVAAAARHLGIHRQSLQRMLKKLPPNS
jgi:two-component system response regulator RegA